MVYLIYDNDIGFQAVSCKAFFLKYSYDRISFLLLVVFGKLNGLCYRFWTIGKSEQKADKEETKKIAQAIELIYNELDKKSESLVQQKKLELKYELTKELAIKADLEILKTELEVKIEIDHKELEAKIDKEVLKLQNDIKSLIKSLRLCLLS